MTICVRRATADETAALRQAVLRPGTPVKTSGYAFEPAAVTYGAWDGEVNVGCATVFPEPWRGPRPEPEPRAWRLRGMAVAPGYQGQGIGQRVLAEAVAVARQAGAPLIWANARTAALAFYQRQGWTVAGEEFLTEDTGLPHYPIVLRLAPNASIDRND